MAIGFFEMESECNNCWVITAVKEWIFVSLNTKMSNVGLRWFNVKTIRMNRKTFDALARRLVQNWNRTKENVHSLHMNGPLKCIGPDTKSHYGTNHWKKKYCSNELFLAEAVDRHHLQTVLDVYHD